MAGDVTERFLSTATANAGYWPSDPEVVQAMQTLRLYKDLTQTRLRMVLEALEDDRRGKWAEHEHCPRGTLTIEHVMPQSWEQYWGDDVTDHPARQRRDRLVQTLGNLTLVNERLNPKLSNRPWKDSEAQTEEGEELKPVPGKRGLLLWHATLKLNAERVARHPDTWTEEAIMVRSTELAETITKIWPRPNGQIEMPTS
ncbi:HNH endonuclease family protein [Microtetraspora malaysiensis]|uniref:HNH endonuclease family protein n=1 Tax=Microtetraspora malaysiensis TaxID=161358 RepID=UPI003D940378